MKKIPWKLLSIIVIITSYTLNLVDVSIGGYATIYNLIVTVCYVVYWVIYLLFNKNDYGKLKFSSIISGITFISTLIISIVNFTDYTIKYWNTIYLLTFFATPFYGIRFFVHNMSWCMVVITTIAGIWAAYSTIICRTHNPASLL